MVRSNPTRKQTFQVKARLKQNDTKTEKTRRPSKKLQAAKSKTLPARIRDLTRLLRKDNLPADVRTQTEEKLAELKQELERKRSERSQQELEKRMTLKYRKIKFFERRKVERRLAQLRRKLAELEGTQPVTKVLIESEQLREVTTSKRCLELIEQCEQDLLYIQHYPRTIPYISLFASGDADEAEKRRTIRLSIIEDIKHREASGLATTPTATARERDFVSDDDFFVEPTPTTSKEAASLSLAPSSKTTTPAKAKAPMLISASAIPTKNATAPCSVKKTSHKSASRTLSRGVGGNGGEDTGEWEECMGIESKKNGEENADEEDDGAEAGSD